MFHPRSTKTYCHLPFGEQLKPMSLFINQPTVFAYNALIVNYSIKYKMTVRFVVAETFMLSAWLKQLFSKYLLFKPSACSSSEGYILICDQPSYLLRAWQLDPNQAFELMYLRQGPGCPKSVVFTVSSVTEIPRYPKSNLRVWCPWFFDWACGKFSSSGRQIALMLHFNVQNLHIETYSST